MDHVSNAEISSLQNFGPRFSKALFLKKLRFLTLLSNPSCIPPWALGGILSYILFDAKWDTSNTRCRGIGGMGEDDCDAPEGTLRWPSLPAALPPLELLSAKRPSE